MTDHAPPQPSQPWNAAPGSDLGGYWPTPQQPPQSARASRRRWGVVDLLMVLALAFLGVVWATLRVTSGPHPEIVPGGGTGLVPGIAATTAPTTAPTTAAPSGGGATPSAGGRTPGASGPHTPSGRKFDVAAIAAVDPSVVHIVTTLDAGRASAAGTGIVLTSAGEVLTNYHVIEGGTSIAVTVAIGNAGGRGGTPTAVAGAVSGLDLAITATDADGGNSERLTGLIQIDANIEPGDSGGPLVDSSAHVVGVVTAATASHGGEAGGTGSAIPISLAVAVARQIETGQGSDTVHVGATAFLGVAVAAASHGSGVIITEVAAGSPADEAGLRPGDSVLSIDAIPVDSASTLSTLLIPHHPGDQVAVSIVGRGGRVRGVTVRLATGPAA